MRAIDIIGFIDTQKKKSCNLIFSDYNVCLIKFQNVNVMKISPFQFNGLYYYK